MAQKITKMHLKRAVSAFLAVATAITTTPTIAISAEEAEKYPYTLFAGSYSEGAITTTAGNFCVNGNVATNGTIIAAGNMNINGTKTENAGEEMIYIFNKIESKYFSGNNVDEYAEDYTLEEMNINVTEPLEVGGEIEMTSNINLTTAIKAYDTVSLNGEVKNTSESVICSETGDIIIDCTNVNLNGLVYAPDGSVEITAQNLNLNNVIIIADTILLDCPNVNANYGSSVAEFIGTESEVVPIIYAIGTYNAEETCIDIMWSTNCEDGSFEIMYSDDDVTYTSVDTVTGTDTYKYLITEDFEKRYFKVVLTTAYGETIEATPFIVTKTEDGYIADLYDTDGDEVADILEELIGTDIEDVDTDDDGLTDYQEYCITGTDPLVYDSVTTGISDADADADNDGLTTTQEIENNTNPQSADTDSDTLSDYEELYKYGTDPLSPDTDEDTISDGNELNVGLDPLNPETFGVPDAEYKQVQTISADSEALSAINTAENPYKLSIEFTATGYAESALTAKETGYAVAIDNDSMFGIAPELIYSGECEDITLKFEIADEYLDYSVSNEEISGVKRYNVFKFYEDTNMLLPIVTYYDIDNDTIYAEVDELGTYCVMDMVSWFESFGILLEDYQPEPMLMTLSDDYMLASAEETEETSEDELAFAGGPADIETATVEETVEEEEIQEDELMVAEAPMLMSAYSLSSDEELTKAQTPLDLVFILQAEGNSEKRFEEQKQAVIDTSELVFNYFDDARISIIYFDYYSASWFMNGWFRDLSSIEDNIDDIAYENIARYCDRDKAFNVLLNRLSYRDNAAKFVFNLVDGWSYSSNFANHIDVCNSERFNYSEMWAEGWNYTYESDRIRIENLIYSTGGIVDRIDEDVHQVMYDHICDYIVAPETEFDAYYLSNWHPVSLNAPIDPEEGGNRDGGELTDWKEINTELLSWDGNGKVVLPTVAECLSSQVKNSLTAKSSIEEDVAKIEDWMNTSYALPIFSNPQKLDSDEDGIADISDASPLKAIDADFVVIDNPPNYDIEQLIYVDYQKAIQEGQDCYDSIEAEWHDGLVDEVLALIMGVGGMTPLSTYLLEIKTGVAIGSTPHGARALLHFIQNSGTDFYIPLEIPLGLSKVQRSQYYAQMNSFFDMIEETAIESNFYSFATSQTPSKTWFVNYHELKAYNKRIANDWWLTLGGAYNAMVAGAGCYIAEDGQKHYTAKVNYYVYDYYDWDAIKDFELGMLHKYGKAQNFRVIGSYTIAFDWIAGKRYPEPVNYECSLETTNFDGINDNSALEDAYIYGCIYYNVFN